MPPSDMVTPLLDPVLDPPLEPPLELPELPELPEPLELPPPAVQIHPEGMHSQDVSP
jgi:hypothetical protein